MFNSNSLGMNRRSALGFGTMSLIGAAIGSPAIAAVTSPAKTLPFDDPQWNREQAARLQAHTDGRQIYGRCSGTINGVRPGEAVRTLLGFEVFSTIRVVRRPDGNFDRMSKEVVFYTDPATGDPLDFWDNPYTGERVRVVDIANDPYNWVIRDWVGPPPMPGADTHNLVKPTDAKPFKLHWSEFGPDNLVIHEGGHAYYPNRLDPDIWPRESSGKMVQVSELFRYFVRRSDVANAKLDHLPHNGIWLRITPWLPWMLMGDTPGHVMYEGEFRPADTLAFHSPKVIDRVRKRYPQYLEAPTKWYGPSLSSLEHYALEQKPAPVRK